MREIKFKAYVKEMNLVLPVLSIQFDFKKVEVPATYSNHIDTEYFNFEQVELIQYTGLKDSKGNEIYEGDMILVLDWNRKYKVIFEKGMFKASGSTAFSLVTATNGELSCEVIGNIYENQ